MPTTAIETLFVDQVDVEKEYLFEANRTWVYA